MEHVIVGFVTACIVMVVAWLVKRSSPIFWGCVAMGLVLLFDPLLGLMSHLALRRWVEQGSNEVVVIVIANLIAGGVAVTAMMSSRRKKKLSRNRYKRAGVTDRSRSSRSRSGSRSGDSRIASEGVPASN